ncbi:MAG: SDR family oxidoreductase [Dehalococcoidia bacterium]|nr:SDR family oxidoreductase [Dehalococcoidia bacterium]
MAGKLAGKVVMVTGSESGIGRSVVKRCAAEGASVTVTGIQMDKAKEVQKEIESAGGKAIAVETDVLEQAQIENALDQTIKTFGRIDAVHANAGFGYPATPFWELPMEEWDRVIGVNLRGKFMTLQAGARRLLDQGQGGSLLATGSSTVFRPGTQRIAYVAAKGAIHTMIRALALEMGPHNIRVNAIAPGLTDTPGARGLAPTYMEEGLKIVAMGELVDPDELGALAAHIFSDDARHMTGSIVQLDAGRTAD